jgi:hypothetical protein
MKPFFIEIINFWAGQTNWADTFLDIWGIFGQTISTHFGTVSSFFSIIQPLFLQNTKPLYHLELGFGPQRIRDLAFVCP